jgi:hypothetical protein
MKYRQQVKNYQHVMMSNFQVTSHKPYTQTNYITVASAKQAFQKGTSILLTCTRLSENVYCVK